MKYVFSVSGAYSCINYVARSNDVPIEHSVFSDILINYLQSNIKRWYFGQPNSHNTAMMYVGLSRYLTADESDVYMDYLDNTFWVGVCNCITTDINLATNVTISIASDNSLVVEITPEPSPLDKVINRICVEVDHLLESGGYVDATLKEIYDANLQSR